MGERIMISKNTNEEQNTTNSIKIVDKFPKYLFIAALIFSIPGIINISIDHTTLSPRLFSANLILVILTAILIFLAIFSYGSLFIYHFFKNKNLTRSNHSTTISEQTNITKRSYKIGRIFIWTFYIGAIIASFANVTCMIISIIVT